MIERRLSSVFKEDLILNSLAVEVSPLLFRRPLLVQAAAQRIIIRLILPARRIVRVATAAILPPVRCITALAQVETSIILHRLARITAILLSAASAMDAGNIIVTKLLFWRDKR